MLTNLRYKRVMKLAYIRNMWREFFKANEKPCIAGVAVARLSISGKETTE